MKKKVIILTLALLILVGSGCQKSSDSGADGKVKKEKTTKTTEADETEETEEASIEETITEAAEETTIETEETTTEASNEIELSMEEIALYDRLVESVGEENILSFFCDDFDMDGTYEAFALVGEDAGYEDSVFYDGTFYYISGKDDNDVEAIKESDPVYFGSLGEVLDFGSRKYFVIHQDYTTARMSSIYTVRDGECVEDMFSNRGELRMADGYDFTITVSAYDGAYDFSSGNYLSHTWKPYYFYYSPEDDEIVEYVGQEITIDEANEFLNDDAIATLEADGYDIDNAYIRDNGIININYHAEGEDSIHYSNLNYDTVNAKYLENFYGIYYRSILGE